MKSLFSVFVISLLTRVIFINGQQQVIPSKLSPKGRLLTPAEGCGYTRVRNSRIVGGSDAKIGAWPWMALLGYVSGETEIFFCGGTLITSKHVLTAAHCIQDELLNVVRLAEHDTRTTSDGQHQDIEIAYSDVHEEYDEEIDLNDIAIVHLAHDIEFNDRIRPICLPIKGPITYRRFVDSNAFIAGWGTTQSSSENSHFPVLQQVQVPVIKNKDCKESYDKIDQLIDDIQFDDRVVCAGFTEGGKDSCQGDSGGPLMLPIHENGTFPFYQIGIISYADGCGEPDVPGVNTNVQYYARWIKKKLFM